MHGAACLPAGAASRVPHATRKLLDARNGCLAAEAGLPHPAVPLPNMRSPDSMPRLVRPAFKNLARGALLTVMATFLGPFLFFTVPDFLVNTITKSPMPLWFYQSEVRSGRVACWSVVIPCVFGVSTRICRHLRAFTLWCVSLSELSNAPVRRRDRASSMLSLGMRLSRSADNAAVRRRGALQLPVLGVPAVISLC